MRKDIYSLIFVVLVVILTLSFMRHTQQEEIKEIEEKKLIEQEEIVVKIKEINSSSLNEGELVKARLLTPEAQIKYYGGVLVD